MKPHKYLLHLQFIPTLLNRLYIPVCKNGKASIIKNPNAKGDLQRIQLEAIRQRCNKPIEGDISIKIDFCIKGRDKDIDGIQKFLFDSLEGISFKNDKQITELIVRKHRKQPRDELIISMEKIDD